jgi:hypothetical protein
MRCTRYVSQNNKNNHCGLVEVLEKREHTANKTTSGFSKTIKGFMILSLYKNVTTHSQNTSLNL